MNHDEEKAPALFDATVTARIEGEHLVYVIADRVQQQISEKLEARIEAVIDEVLGGAVSKAVEARIQAAVDEVLSGGFPQRDPYGRELPAKTLRDLVIEQLDTRDTYERKPRIPAALDKALNYEIKRIVDEQAAAARETFKAQVDEMVKAKFAEALRKSVGL